MFSYRIVIINNLQIKQIWNECPKSNIEYQNKCSVYQLTWWCLWKTSTDKWFNCTAQAGHVTVYLNKPRLCFNGASTVGEASVPNYYFPHAVQQGRKGGGAVMCLHRDVFGCQNVMQGEFFCLLNMLLSQNIRQASSSIFVINYRPRQSNSDFLGECSELLWVMSTRYNNFFF